MPIQLAQQSYQNWFRWEGSVFPCDRRNLNQRTPALVALLGGGDEWARLVIRYEWEDGSYYVRDSYDIPSRVCAGGWSEVRKWADRKCDIALVDWATEAACFEKEAA